MNVPRPKFDSVQGTQGPSPLTGLTGKDLFSSARTLLSHALLHPVHTAKHASRFANACKDIAAGTSTLAPLANDKRFSDPTWKNNTVYRRSLQTWLAWRQGLQEWIDDSALTAADAHRSHFLLGQLTEALAPSNTPANPAAVKRCLETGGKSIATGCKHLFDDIVHNGGLPSQIDKNAFKVGVDVATSAGAVVFRNEVLELIQYQPLTDQVFERPLLFVPPQINKFYVFDLSPDKSVARYCLQQNMQTFMISWRNPSKNERDWDLAVYLQAIKDAIDAVLSITGCETLNLLGACSGGIATAALLGHYAALNQHKVHSLTLLVSVLDISTDTEVGLFVDDQVLDEAKNRSYKNGVLEGRDLAKIFAWMRPNDLIWSYWVNNYLLGLPPAAFDILFWNNDTTRLPAAFHGDLIEMMKHNPLTRPGALEVCDTPVDLRQVTCDVFCLAGSNDHITPWKACYNSARLFGGKCEFVLSSSGHIQSILNPPGNPKARYLTNKNLPVEPTEWQAHAATQEGSWWAYWQAWLAERAGPLKPAPATLGNQAYSVITPAPGTYVHQC